MADKPKPSARLENRKWKAKHKDCIFRLTASIFSSAKV